MLSLSGSQGSLPDRLTSAILQYQAGPAGASAEQLAAFTCAGRNVYFSAGARHVLGCPEMISTDAGPSAELLPLRCPI